MLKERNLYILVIGLILVVLLVTPTVYGEDVHSTSGQVNLPGDRYWGYHISLPEGGGIKYEIEANTTVNVYLMDSPNLAKYQAGQNFEYIEGGSALGTKHAKVQYSIGSNEGGDYYLIVESTDYQDVSFTYNVTYGKDVKISAGDFINLIPGIFQGSCNWTYIIIFIIWLLVVAWVYKDAKRRGKSGILWALVVLIFNIIGLIIWLIVRPRKKQQAYYTPPPPPPMQ